MLENSANDYKKKMYACMTTLANFVIIITVYLQLHQISAASRSSTCVHSNYRLYQT